MGVPWWLTTGVNAFGSEAERTAREGASYDEAATSGLISAGAEIFTEAISKGLKYKGKSISDRAAQKIGDYMSSDFITTALRYGIDGTNEGMENVIAWGIEKFGQWLTYQDEQTLKEVLLSEQARKEASEAFWSGFIWEGTAGGTYGKKGMLEQTKNRIMQLINGYRTDSMYYRSTMKKAEECAG